MTVWVWVLIGVVVVLLVFIGWLLSALFGMFRPLDPSR